MPYKKNKITKNTKLSEILKKYPETHMFLFEKGLHCIGCPFASEETLEQGALSHGMGPDELVREISAKIKSKK